MSWKKLIVLIAGLAAVATLVPVTTSAATHYFTTTKIVTVYGKENADTQRPGVRTAGMSRAADSI